jgi:hypothetical protein
MDHSVHNKLVSFIWSIADDCLRDVYVRGKYRDVILPMVVLRRLDTLLETSKEAVLEEVKYQKEEMEATDLDDEALKQASGQVFYNISKWTLKSLHSTATNNQQILLAQEIRQAPLEHFAPSTVAYGTAILYLLISCFRIVFGTQQTAVNRFKLNLLVPLANFYSTLCRAMIGGLLGITILTIIFDFKSYLWVFFLFSFIYPGLIMFVVQSMDRLVDPIAVLKIDKGSWGTRFVGILMIALALVSGLAIYALDVLGDNIILMISE